MSLQLQTPPDFFVWIQTGFLGDIILTTAAMQLAKKKFKKIKHILITTPVGASALGREPVIDHVIAWDKRKDGALAGFKSIKQQLDHIIAGGSAVILQSHSSARSSLLCKYLGRPTIAYKEAKLSFLADYKIPRLAAYHEAHRIGLLLEPFGLSRDEICASRPQLTPTGVGRGLEAIRSKAKFLVGIAPGSVWGTKRWPAERFAGLVKTILEQTDWSVVLLGAPSDKEQSDIVVQSQTPASSSERMIDLVGKTSIAELVDVYNSLDLVVSNDSSPVHYASALDKPIVSIFGATVPALGFYPLTRSAPAEVVEVKNLPCRPCSDHGPQTCPIGHFDCMKQISVDMLWQRIQSVASQL